MGPIFGTGCASRTCCWRQRASETYRNAREKRESAIAGASRPEQATRQQGLPIPAPVHKPVDIDTPPDHATNQAIPTKEQLTIVSDAERNEHVRTRHTQEKTR